MDDVKEQDCGVIIVREVKRELACVRMHRRKVVLVQMNELVDAADGKRFPVKTFSTHSKVEEKIRLRSM